MKELYLYSEIGEEGVTDKTFIDSLQAAGPGPIKLHVNSPGGSVFMGLAIYNSIRQFAGEITAYVDGVAASMASAIVCACSKVCIAANGLLMLHNPAGLVAGDSNAMTDTAGVLRTLEDSLAKCYMKKTGASRQTVRAWMDKTTWFNAQDAKRVGLCDAIFDGPDIQANFALLAKFPNCPIRPAAKELRGLNRFMADTKAQLDRDYPLVGRK